MIQVSKCTQVHKPPLANCNKVYVILCGVQIIANANKKSTCIVTLIALVSQTLNQFEYNTKTYPEQ